MFKKRTSFDMMNGLRPYKFHNAIQKRLKHHRTRKRNRHYGLQTLQPHLRRSESC